MGKRKSDGYSARVNPVPPGDNPRIKKKEVEPVTVADEPRYTYTNEYKKDKPVLFVPDDVKLKRVKKTLKQERIKKDKLALDFWLRHTLGLGTKQIKKLWKKLDEIYRVK